MLASKVAAGGGHAVNGGSEDVAFCPGKLLLMLESLISLKRQLHRERNGKSSKDVVDWRRWHWEPGARTVDGGIEASGFNRLDHGHGRRRGGNEQPWPSAPCCKEGAQDPHHGCRDFPVPEALDQELKTGNPFAKVE